MRKKSDFQIKLEYFALRFVFGIIGAFPLSAAMTIGKFLGFAAYYLAKRQRKVAYRNLEIAFPEMPEKEKQKIVRGCFRSLGRQLGIFAKFPVLTPENVRDLVEIKGFENFEKAHETGRGIIFCTAHLGAWELQSLSAPAFAYPGNIVVRRTDNPLIENFIESLRTRFGSKTIDKKSSARVMFRILKKGGFIGILADLNSQENEGVFVDFFGVPASTTTGVAKLALKTEALVMPMFMTWNEEKKRYVWYIEPPLEISKSDDEETDIKNLTQAVTFVVEDFIRRFPEQWMWIHKRWNTRPKGEKGFY